ncbi:MAG: DUF368 domain-containing protein [Bacilli bacterium]|nr:DUF368 domain-containing protein [Bacilli bacterium]
MRDKFFDFLKGIIVGIANILPGFSGGVMAVSFNVYDKLIYALTNFYKKPIQVFKDIWGLALGIGFGILISIFGIKLFLDNFPIPTIFFFTGLIVGSIPNIYDRVDAKRINWKKVLSFLFGFGLITALLIFSITYNETNTGVVIGSVSVKDIIILFFVGIIAAATMIIPGVSGSLILLAIGYYNYIIDFTTSFIKSVFSIDFNGIFSNLLLVIALGLGIVVGMLSLAKIVEKLIDKHPKLFYSVVLGLLIASPFAIIYQMYIEYKEIIQDSLIRHWIFGILFLIIGVVTSIYITKSENKNKLEK